MGITSLSRVSPQTRKYQRLQRDAATWLCQETYAWVFTWVFGGFCELLFLRASLASYFGCCLIVERFEKLGCGDLGEVDEHGTNFSNLPFVILGEPPIGVQ